MALNIKIDFENRYPVFPVDGLNYSIFNTQLCNRQIVRLGIKISSDEHPLMKDVFNLAFGPVDDMHQIDDQIKLPHLDHSKVFYGVNYYVRILRDGNNNCEEDDFLTIPRLIEKGETVVPIKLYNYFIFRVKSAIKG